MFSIFEKLASITIKIRNIFSSYRIDSPSVNFGKGNLFLKQDAEIKQQSKGEAKETEVADELWKMVVKRIEERVDYGRGHGTEKLRNNANQLTLTRQYFDQNSIYFDEELKEIFGKLYNKLQNSYSDEGAKGLEELFHLKDLFGQKIQRIVRRD